MYVSNSHFVKQHDSYTSKFGYFFQTVSFGLCMPMFFFSSFLRKDESINKSYVKGNLGVLFSCFSFCLRLATLETQLFHCVPSLSVWRCFCLCTHRSFYFRRWERYYPLCLTFPHLHKPFTLWRLITLNWILQYSFYVIKSSKLDMF